MNKKKSIIIGILSLALVMVVGYALFSDTITINGTASAEGDFDVGITCQTGVVQEFVPSGADSSTLGEGGYKNDSCSVTEDKMNFSVNLEYPGATRYFTAKITNNGTIDATLDLNTGVSVSGTVSYDSNENGTFEENEIFNVPLPDSDPITSAIINGLTSIEGGYPYGFERSDGTKIAMTDEEATGEFSNEDGSILLKPGNSVYMLFMAQLDSKLGNDRGGSFLTKTDLTYTFTFTQPAGN